MEGNRVCMKLFLFSPVPIPYALNRAVSFFAFLPCSKTLAHPLRRLPAKLKSIEGIRFFTDAEYNDMMNPPMDPLKIVPNVMSDDIFRNTTVCEVSDFVVFSKISTATGYIRRFRTAFDHRQVFHIDINCNPCFPIVIFAYVNAGTTRGRTVAHHSARDCR